MRYNERVEGPRASEAKTRVRGYEGFDCVALRTIAETIPQIAVVFIPSRVPVRILDAGAQ